MAPPSTESPKRNGGAPRELAKLDLQVERQKSARPAVEKTAGATASKPKSAAREPLEDEWTENQHAATQAKKPATKNDTKAATTKGGKTVKVAVAAASEDQFNDIGELAKTGPASKGKPGTLAATSGTKPRPASAGVGPAKPTATTRPASAGAKSPTPKHGGSGLKRIPSGSATKRKPAFEASAHDAGSEAAGDNGDDDDKDEKRSLGDKEPAAKGLYDIFVQTRRCEKLCYEVGLKLKHIRKMKRKFDENDMYHTGEITQAELFFIINEDRRPLTKGILQYGNVSPGQKFMSFDEYLLCVVSFAVLTPPEVYQYAFDLYDADRSGTLDEREFAKMSKEMQSKQFSFPKNTQMAIKMIEGKDSKRGSGGGGGGYVSEDGLVDLGEFMKFAKLFPVAFYPLFNFQKNVRRATLGESKWSKFAARKLKIQELVSHMRRNYGAIPELSLGQRLWSIVDDELLAIRKRASEIYGQELNQRRLIGHEHNGDGDGDDA